MRIALASPRIAISMQDGLERVDRLAAQAASQGARLTCFPEAYLPGLRGQDFAVPAYSAADQEQVLAAGSRLAQRHRMGLILGLEWIEGPDRHIAAAVFAPGGGLLGLQTKNQLDPSEESSYRPGTRRSLFQIDELKFGISICHEAWRYPETVRWAALRGAHIVFQPQHTGFCRQGPLPRSWGDPAGAYYEKAMLMRSLENNIYFGSVNYALPCPESATSLIDPQGVCQAYLDYATEGVLVETLDLSRAHARLARRYAPERYQERPVECPLRIYRADRREREPALAIVEEYCRAVEVVVRDSSEQFDGYFKDGAGMWLARSGGSVVGCLALRPLELPDACEVKRLYVQKAWRGQGLAERLLAELEDYARAFGYRWCYLDTKDDLTSAIRFYTRRGYQRCARYNQNPQATIFMRKWLGPESEVLGSKGPRDGNPPTQ